jgi:O-antigen biosynthesis protein
VLFFTHNLNYEGAPLSAVATMQGLAEAGAQIGVIAEKDGPLRQRLEQLGTRLWIRPGGLMSLPRLMFHYGRELLLARQFRPDLIYGNTLHMFQSVWIARALGVPAIWCIRESISPSLPTLPSRRAILKTFALRPNAVFVADATRRLWQPVAGDAPCHVIPNGLPAEEIDRFREGASIPQLRRRIGLPEGSRAVVIVGTTCPRKGQHVFLEAAIKLLRRYPKTVHFLIVGARPDAYLDGLRQTIAQARVEDRVHLINEGHDVFKYYAIADVFCCCSFEESHPRVVLEAMAFGLPIVATRVWGIPEQVEDGKSALLVEPGDTLALAARISEILDDPEIASQLGKQARLRFEADFKMETMVRRYTELCERLLASPSPGG